MSVYDYHSDPDLNLSIAGINVAEGCPPSGINDALRQLMADVRAHADSVDTALSAHAASAQAAIDAARNEALAAAEADATAKADAALAAALEEAEAKTEAVRAAAEEALSASSSTLEAKVASAVPVGTVLAFAGNSAPAGWLLCNGAAVSRSIYAALFGVVGTLFGAGDGVSTFNLPNLASRFIEGTSGAPGTYRSAGLPNIWGSLQVGGNYDMLINATGAFSRTYYGHRGPGASNDVGCTFDFNASRCSAVYGASGTVQPPSLTLRYFIKY